MFRGRWSERENFRNATVNCSTNGTSATDEISLLAEGFVCFFLKKGLFLLATNIEQIIPGKNYTCGVQALLLPRDSDQRLLSLYEVLPQSLALEQDLKPENKLSISSENQ